MNHDYEPLTKKRKLISTSRGNYKFSNGHLKLGKKLEPENDLQILAWLTAGCGQCCSRVPDEGSCCLLQHFKRNDNLFYWITIQIFCFIEVFLSLINKWL